jgi:hypothetical protein
LAEALVVVAALALVVASAAFVVATVGLLPPEQLRP